jgi:hypothetical protein
VTVVVGVLMLMFVVELVVAGFLAVVDAVCAESLLPPPETASATTTPAPATTITASSANQAFREPERRRAPQVGHDSAFGATGAPQFGQNPDPG